jgi:hypothetical protein
MFCSGMITGLNFSVQSVNKPVDLVKTNLFAISPAGLPALNASALCLKMRVNEWLPGWGSFITVWG